MLAQRAGLGRYPLILTIYAWPGLPGRAAWKHAGWRACARATSCRRGCWPRPPAAGPRATVGACPRARAASSRRTRACSSGCPAAAYRSSACPPVHPVDDRRASRPCSGRGPHGHLRRAVRDGPRHRDAHRRVPRRHERPCRTPACACCCFRAPSCRVIRGPSPPRPAADAIDVVTDPIPDLLGELASRPGRLLAVPRRLHHLAAGDGGRGGDGGRPSGRVDARRLRALGHAPGHRRHRRPAR